MNIIEIAAGTITVEMQPEDAMYLAQACHRVLEVPYGGDETRERQYRLYQAIFEALAVAGNAQYSIMDDQELTSGSLTALRSKAGTILPHARNISPPQP